MTLTNTIAVILVLSNCMIASCQKDNDLTIMDNLRNLKVYPIVGTCQSIYYNNYTLNFNIHIIKKKDQ